jgi:hypothetical protein
MIAASQAEHAAPHRNTRHAEFEIPVKRHYLVFWNAV